jgi:hypothetical protein
MHPLPSHLAYELCQARRAEVERRKRQPAGFARGAQRPGGMRSVRQSTGWFLVELGLRLAVPHPPLGAVR